MKYCPHIQEAVERHRRWWTRERTDRPLIMIDFNDVGVRTTGHLSDYWEDPAGYVAAMEADFAKRAGMRDDKIPEVRPPFSHGALPGILGGPVANMSGSLWAGHLTETARDIVNMKWDPDTPLGRQFAAYYGRIRELAEGKFAVSAYELPGPSQFTGSLQKMDEFILECADEPEFMAEVCMKTAELSVAFYKWAAELANAGQETYGGQFQPLVWAPKNTLYWCDHTAINFSPELFEQALLPAIRKLHEAFERSFMFCYPGEGPHVFPAMWRACANLTGIHNCQGEMPGQSGAMMKSLGLEGEKKEWAYLDTLYREFAGKKSFIIKCPPERIAHYREIFPGDAGLGIWTFAPNVAEANRIVDSL
ncbi:MAG: hypothetical protein HY291_14635 [Planctomycetes bacterium]|nr:hypothetical protein [Planctomycetota bacterium]